MFKDLVTKRLLLKNISEDDIDFMYKEFSTNEVNTYLYDAEPISSMEEALEWVTLFSQPEMRNQHRWIIILKETGEKIGTCGFHCWDRKNGTIEIGYDLQPSYWRCGYVSEAMKVMLQFAKDDMEAKSVYAHIAVENIASIKTAEKQGFYKTASTYFEDISGLIKKWIKWHFMAIDLS